VLHAGYSYIVGLQAEQMRAAGSEGLLGPAFFVPYAHESLEGARPIRGGYGGFAAGVADVRASILGSEETLHI
jgi:hypothetical protein